MLYILPPPSAPSPPSAWNSILCAGATSAAAGGGNNQQSSGGAGNRNNVITNGTITSWGVVEPPDKKPFFKVRSSHMKQRAATVPKDSGSGIPLVEDDSSKGGKSLSECYFAGKGAALVLPPHDRGPKHSRRASVVGSDIQQHLQAMFYLLRPEETLKMAVKLESARAGRTRYLVVVSRPGRKDAEESCLLGIDCNEQTTVGLVLRVLADTGITLDGDGGFSVSVCGRQHIFKPVSVQAMWSALQTLHKVSSKAREENYFLGGLTHEWVSYYEQRIESDRSCLNEWHAMDSLESRRPPSPDSLRTKPRQRDETEQVIRSTLKEIMMSVDLDEVTSKYIRSRLEEDLDMDLGEFKSFIDQEMLTILGQMDSPTEIFDHVYLGSEWNASNLEELQKNGVRHILNVTREIDNFFPGMFDYHNIRVYDDEKTDLLKHWDNTFKYIHQAKEKGSKVLVHCKMGVSRSASVVIAYAMKAYDWDFNTAMQHVKEKRTCIKPNTSFLAQLETYQGILDAMKNKEKLQRSKSETNLKSPVLSAKSEKIIPGSEPTPMVQAMQKSALQSTMSGHELRQLGNRPKSWSPDNRIIANLLPDHAAPISISLEHLNRESSTTDFSKIISDEKVSSDNSPTPPSAEVENRNVLMPCGNGQSYSVSQNQIFHLPGSRKVSSEVEVTIPSVKYRVIELESQSVKQSTKPQLDKKGLVLNLTSQFENNASKPSSPSPSEELSDGEKTPNNTTENTEPAPEILTSILVKKEIWDPGEVSNDSDENNVSYKTCDLVSSSTTTNNDCLVWTPARSTENTNSNEPNKNVTDSDVDVSDKSLIKTVSTRPVVPLFKKEGDPFSNQLDRIFDREERKEHRKSTLVANINVHSSHQDDNQSRDCPSRQSSWSSYDSAVVLGYQGESRDVPSRHSSWGSGDTRTLPSRNSSWGSYDIKITNGPVDELSEQVHPTDNLLENSSSGMFPYDKNDMPPWYPGTVKRTKQKLEEGTVKRICSDNKQVLCPYHTNSAEILKCKYSGNKNVVEAINTGMLCCAVSPALCTCGENDSTVKNESNTCKVVTESKNIESNSSTKKIDINSSSNNLLGIRLSASAPENSSISLLSESDITSSSSLMDLSVLDQQNFKNEDEANVTYSNVKQHKLYIENLSKNKNPKRHFLVDDSDADSNKNIVGIVKNLKREFEAKTGPKIDKSVDLPIVESDTTLKNKVKSVQTSQATPLETGLELVVPETETKGKVKSLPSSPVSVHVDLKQETASSQQDLEDISVKKLVGKYEISNWNSDKSVITSFKSNESNDKSFRNNQKRNCENSVQKYPPAITKTSLLVHNLKNKCDTECKWPPVAPTVRNPAPSVMLASVVTSAANKKQQQHGKTHPLTRLAVNKQHRNSPVYNTM